MIESGFAFLALVFGGITSIFLCVGIIKCVYTESIDNEKFLKIHLALIGLLFMCWYIAHTMGL